MHHTGKMRGVPIYNLMKNSLVFPQTHASHAYACITCTHMQKLQECPSSPRRQARRPSPKRQGGLPVGRTGRVGRACLCRIGFPVDDNADYKFRHLPRARPLQDLTVKDGALRVAVPRQVPHRVYNGWLVIGWPGLDLTQPATTPAPR